MKAAFNIKGGARNARGKYKFRNGCLIGFAQFILQTRVFVSERLDPKLFHRLVYISTLAPYLYYSICNALFLMLNEQMKNVTQSRLDTFDSVVGKWCQDGSE